MDVGVRPAPGEFGGEFAAAAARVDHVTGTLGGYPGDKIEEGPGTLARVAAVDDRVPHISRHKDT